MIPEDNSKSRTKKLTELILLLAALAGILTFIFYLIDRNAALGNSRGVITYSITNRFEQVPFFEEHVKPIGKLSVGDRVFDPPEVSKIVSPCGGGLAAAVDTDQDGLRDRLRGFGSSVVSASALEQLGQRAISIQEDFARNRAASAMVSFGKVLIDAVVETTTAFSENLEGISFNQHSLESLRTIARGELYEFSLRDIAVIEGYSDGSKCVVVAVDAKL